MIYFSIMLFTIFKVMLCLAGCVFFGNGDRNWTGLLILGYLLGTYYIG